VELPVNAATEAVGGDAMCTARYAGHRVDALIVGTRCAPDLPPLWFGEVVETAASPPATNLLAFAGPHVSPGALLDVSALRGVGVKSEDQVGAVRWYPATGEVDQIYVQPAWRRRRIANALIAAAAALSYAREWPRLWSDGQRTELGEQLRNNSSWRGRTADLTHLAPAMTPPQTV
jgi:GNAT superfamily N-acetyltransferase